MRSLVAAIVLGALFGAGLLVSGMADPQRVRAFLDLRHWDPTLAFVMAGAIAIYLPAHRAIMRRRAPLFDGAFHLPERGRIDRRLVVGAAVFGIGWGLVGYCPGPAVVAAAAGVHGGLVFVAAMLAGMLAQHRLHAR